MKIWCALARRHRKPRPPYSAAADLLCSHSCDNHPPPSDTGEPGAIALPWIQIISIDRQALQQTAF